MFEVLSIIAGAIILLIGIKMFFALWDDTDWFGRCLAGAGLLGIEAAVCYFGVVVNNNLYFGFAGMTAIAFFVLIPVYVIKKLKDRRKHGKPKARRLSHG